MKHLRSLPFVLSALVCGLVLGCAGTIARQRVLAPQLTAQTPWVLSYARALPDHDETSAALFEAAVPAGRYTDALAVWPLVQSDATRAINARTDIVQGAKESALERLKQYDGLLRRAVGIAATQP